MAAGCKKCDPHELCEECPEWIFTLADLIMCMMGLFVILWVLKPGPKESTPEGDAEMMKVIIAIREAFDYEPDPNSTDPVDAQMILQKLQHLKPHNSEGEGGQTRLKRQGAEGTDPEVTSIRQGQQAVVGGRLIFDIGDTKLSPETTRSLDQIVEQIRGHRNIVLIKGHASLDDFPPNASAEKRMDLSLRRAQVVADYLTAHGVEPDMLRVQGCSVFEPVVQRRYSVDAQVMNRRVEVEATTTLVSERQDATSLKKTKTQPLQITAPSAHLPAHTSAAH